MSNQMKAEWFKLQKNKTFWALILSIIGISVLLHFLRISGWWQVSGTAFDSAGLSELNALAVFTIPLLFNLMVSTLAGYYISTEFSPDGVIKNQVISGNKKSRIFIAKFLILSLGSILVTIVIPLLTAVIMVCLFGQADILNLSNIMYLGRAFSLFTLQFLCFNAVVLWIAIATEDSGKTIIFTLLLSVIMFAIEKLVTQPFIEMVYENTFFYQFSEVFKYTMTNGETIQSILIGILSLIIILLCGIFIFNRKEIN
ncbi:ABC transporter permease [Virgibacillus sp. CBA3643]|uniref:ABC transporter permease n=1 Tax=Virgibacillus sp. CBA3643 TaxID=2942278 RepID=UPI0035A357C7